MADDDVEKAAAPKQSQATQELGVASAAQVGSLGLINQDEYLPQLRGKRAIKTYREMTNDAIIGAILTAMDMMLRSVEWRVEAADDSEEAQREKEFVDSLLVDMESPWDEFIAEATTFLPYGFSVFEEVYKRRDGPNASTPENESQFDDGRLGLRKLAPRAQWTLDRWQVNDNGDITGFVQQPPNGVQHVTIPIEKLLLFRTSTVNNDPSGRSVLRTAYKAWYYLTHIQNIEAIGIERELNGLPVGRIPGEYLSNNATSDQKSAKSDLEKILRDVKKNEQGYVLLPSDPYEDESGNPTGMRKIDMELLSSSGTRDIDISKVITRYQQDIARSVLADFIMLGVERGSFALSKSKTDLFLRSLQGYLNNIAGVLNRHLLPRVWKLNGLDFNLMPTLVPGDVAPADLGELGEFVRRVAGAGAPLFPDEDLENALRSEAGLPEKDTQQEAVEEMGAQATSGSS